MAEERKTKLELVENINPLPKELIEEFGKVAKELSEYHKEIGKQSVAAFRKSFEDAGFHFREVEIVSEKKQEAPKEIQFSPKEEKLFFTYPKLKDYFPLLEKRKIIVKLPNGKWKWTLEKNLLAGFLNRIKQFPKIKHDWPTVIEVFCEKDESSFVINYLSSKANDLSQTAFRKIENLINELDRE